MPIRNITFENVQPGDPTSHLTDLNMNFGKQFFIYNFTLIYTCTLNGVVFWDQKVNIVFIYIS